MNKSKGILYISLSAFFFSLMAVAVKATPNIPVVEKIFFRNMIGLVPILMNTYHSRTSLKPNNTKLILLRSTFGLIGIFAYYTALSLLSLSDAVIMNKLSPFFVLIFSALFLKEKIKGKQVYALILAVTGALFVIRPSFDLTVIPALIGLSSAIFAGAAYTTVRKLSETDEAIVIVFYFSLITTLITIPVMLITKNFVIPTGLEALLLVLIGLAAVTAQIFMTSAYRYAPAGELAIYTYSNIIFSIIFSIVIWSDFPDLYSLIGATLIVSGGYINYRVKKKKRL